MKRVYVYLCCALCAVPVFAQWELMRVNTSTGQVQPLIGDTQSPIAIELSATTPETPDADTQRDQPTITVEPG